MPRDGLTQIANYIKLCEKQRTTFGFSLGNIASMDETPIWADITSETTVEKKA